MFGPHASAPVLARIRRGRLRGSGPQGGASLLRAVNGTHQAKGWAKTIRAYIGNGTFVPAHNPTKRSHKGNALFARYRLTIPITDTVYHKSACLNSVFPSEVL